MKSLVPFQKDHTTDKFKITASYMPKSNFEIDIEYLLEGDIDSLLCPSPTEPQRKDELWKSTCLEAFLGERKGAYLEINCSPSGEWNAYQFDSYRQNMRPASHITVRLTRMEKDSQTARFFVQIISDKELSLSRVGLSLVLETQQHQKSYWALHHPTAMADFHDQGGWTLDPAPATH